MHFSIGIRFRKPESYLFVFRCCVSLVFPFFVFTVPLTFEVHLSVQINKSHKLSPQQPRFLA